MKNSVRNLSLFISILIVASFGYAGEVTKIELEQLDGKWEGDGSFLLPGVHTTVSIDGKATFKYDKKTKKLRTSLSGDKFMFTYNDSGYLYINPVTDSVSWEVWDNRNKHALYYGIRKDNLITGERMRGDELYELVIDQVATDTIEFKLLITTPEKKVYNKAVFNLWRVK